MSIIGVLALQGAFREHVDHLRSCVEQYGGQYGRAIEVITVRTVDELNKCDALVIPGGESTAMSLIAQRTGVYNDLRRFVHDESKAVWGTCAGLILLSETLETEVSDHVEPFNLVKVIVKRNAFGRQTHSFTKNCDFSDFIPGCSNFPATFIRAPVIEKVLDPSIVRVLFSLPVDHANGEQTMLIVAAKQKDNVLITSFHPELAEEDLRFHDYFIRQFVLPKQGD